MATAKKAAPAKTTKKAAKAEPVEDDLLATKPKKAKAKPEPVDDLLASKKTKKAAPAKKSKAEDEASAEDVRTVLKKTRKATSYTDIANENGFNIRMVRRQARALRDAGEVEITKEATLGYVKALPRKAATA
jgi:hypothetical protein